SSASCPDRHTVRAQPGRPAGPLAPGSRPGGDRLPLPAPGERSGGVELVGRTDGPSPVVGRGSSGRISKNGNSATRPTDKRQTPRRLARLEGALSLDGMALFDIVPTVTDLLRGSGFAAPCHLAQYGVSVAPLSHRGIRVGRIGFRTRT